MNAEYIERWKDEFSALSALSIDNSTNLLDPSAGLVYVAHNQADELPPVGNGRPAEIEKFTKSGEFKTGFGGPTSSIAIDPEGDVYGLDNHAGAAQVNEYSSNGTFIRSFSGEGTPGLGEDRQDERGFGGEPVGLAVDSVSGHILVSVRSFFGDEAAIDEFDGSGHFLNQFANTEIEYPLGTRKQSHLRSAFNMTVDSHGDLYVVDQLSHETNEEAVDVYGPGRFFPSLKLAEPTKREPKGAVLNGSVDPEGQPIGECHFEYVTEAEFEHNVEVDKGEGFADLSSGGEVGCEPEAGKIPANSADNAVSAVIAGLTSGTTYRYRLVAVASGALGGTSTSNALAFTAPGLPKVDSTTVTNVSSQFAKLNAEIDPAGNDTSYQFEYVDAAHYDPAAMNPYAAGATVPASKVEIGIGGPAGNLDVSVTQQIGGLTPSTTYHFRVVASNEVGTTFSAGGEQSDGTFATLPRVVAGLPDHRAYELVTPANKGGASDMFGTAATFLNTDVGYSSDSGDEFLMTSTLANFGAFGASEKDAYVFRREPAQNEWTYKSVVADSLGVQSVVGRVFNPTDFSSEIALSELVGSTASPGGFSLTTLVGHAGGPYTTLHKDSPVHQEYEETEETNLAGGSSDLSHLVLESKNHTLTAGDTGQDPGSNALFERVKVGSGTCTVASPMYEGNAGGCLELINGNGQGQIVSQCGAVLGLGHSPGARQNAVSPDGARVFFTAPDPYLKYNPESVQTAQETNECWDGVTRDAPQIYMRSGDGITKLSAPEAGWTPVGGAQAAIFVGASKDGSKVFFATESELTKDDAGIHDLELYECDIVEEPEGPKCELSRISAGSSGKAAADVWTVPAVSDDGSAVYFTAFGQLVAGLQSLRTGQVYLYRYDTTTRTTAYVATVDESDYTTGLTSSAKWYREMALSTNANYYATPDGRYLLFATAGEVTGYGTDEGVGAYCPVGISGGGSGLPGHCAEVYRYHYEAGSSGDGSAVCVSCNPNGASPVSNAQFAARSAPQDPDDGPIRAMSDDGSEVFFDTADALVPQDTNQTLDVYEWRESTAGEDRISLISSGEDPGPSLFLGASGDGSNVFFGTHARLVPADGDSAGDLYDARVCEPENGNPCLKAASAGTGQCEGDACHNLPAPSVDTTPVSLTFLGSGNFNTEAKPVAVVTNARKLAKALRACRAGRKGRRKKCEAQARERYRKKPGKSARGGQASDGAGRRG
jgi:hypothetical protein